MSDNDIRLFRDSAHSFARQVTLMRELAFMNGLRVGLAYCDQKSTIDLQEMRDFLEMDIHRAGLEYAQLTGSTYGVMDIDSLPDPDDFLEQMRRKH